MTGSLAFDIKLYPSNGRPRRELRLILILKLGISLNPYRVELLYFRVPRWNQRGRRFGVPRS
jgi:hypothetical protein